MEIYSNSIIIPRQAAYAICNILPAGRRRVVLSIQP